jgi:hypothetical protein
MNKNKEMIKLIRRVCRAAIANVQSPQSKASFHPSPVHLQRGNERLLRDLHFPELAHPLLAGSFCLSNSFRLRVASPP